MSIQTIQQRIDAAEGRTDKTGRPRPERTLNLTFSIDQIRTLVEKFDLNVDRDGLPTIVQSIGIKFNMITTSGKFKQTIAERLDGASHVQLSFLIESIYKLCKRYGVDPATEGEDRLTAAIYGEIIKLNFL
jgi:hypothetical protein